MAKKLNRKWIPNLRGNITLARRQATLDMAKLKRNDINGEFFGSKSALIEFGKEETRLNQELGI